mmetsp:Transcript_16801/g.27195  ORF Transcript_16801/g.27195 Transcript_16801/m.27195 type:complete len:217 (-) Transcript_16801:40-690(-)
MPRCFFRAFEILPARHTCMHIRGVCSADIIGRSLMSSWTVMICRLCNHRRVVTTSHSCLGVCLTRIILSSLHDDAMHRFISSTFVVGQTCARRKSCGLSIGLKVSNAVFVALFARRKIAQLLSLAGHLRDIPSKLLDPPVRLPIFLFIFREKARPSLTLRILRVTLATIPITTGDTASSFQSPRLQLLLSLGAFLILRSFIVGEKAGHALAVAAKN